MKKGVKIAIGVASVAALIVVGYLVYKTVTTKSAYQSGTRSPDANPTGSGSQSPSSTPSPTGTTTRTSFKRDISSDKLRLLRPTT